MRLPFFLISLFIGSHFERAFAQELSPDSIALTKELESIVISSVRSNSKMPVSETTLDRQEIKSNYVGQEMPAVLSRTPSVTWYSDGGHFSGYSYMRLRGIDQTRINFTLSGIPLNEPEDQGAYFSNYPDFLNNLESLQVQRGVGTTSNGTTSYGGSVNFESPSLLKPAGAELQTTFGSFNTWQVSPQVRTGLLKNNTSFYVRYSNTGSDGFRDHSGTKGQTIFLTGGYFGKKSVLKFTGFSGESKNKMAYLAVSESDLSTNYKLNYLRDDERDHFKQSLTMLQYSLSIRQNSFLMGSLYYNHLDGNYDVYFDPDMLNFAVRSNFGGALINYHRESNRVTIDAGIHVNQYKRQHFMRIKPNLNSNLYLNAGRKNEVSVFTKVLYTVNQFSLFADLQLRQVGFDYVPDRSVSQSFNKINWTFFNPKLGINFKTGIHSLYVSAGRTSREPTRNDMFAGYDNIDDTNYDEVGDFTKVKPEHVIDIELGTHLNFTNLKLDANVYAMQFKNEIAAIGQLSYIGLPLRKNVSSSYRRGIEITAESSLFKYLKSLTNANFSTNRIQEYTSDSDNTTYKNVAPLLTPSAIINQSFRTKLKVVEPELSLRYSSWAFLNNANDDNFKVPASLVLNASLNVTIMKKHSLAIIANNLTNLKYYTSGYVQNNESYFFAMARRNFFVSLNVRI